jgi:hypothetical protein
MHLHYKIVRGTFADCECNNLRLMVINFTVEHTQTSTHFKDFLCWLPSLLILEVKDDDFKVLKARFIISLSLPVSPG